MTAHVCTMLDFERRVSFTEARECGLTMTARGPAGNRLFVCPRHDGDAADPSKTNPRFNSSSKD